MLPRQLPKEGPLQPSRRAVSLDTVVLSCTMLAV